MNIPHRIGSCTYHHKKASKFPPEFKRIIELTGLSVKSISKILNIDYNRLSRLIYNDKTAMNNSEFIKIKQFCDRVIEGNHCYNYNPVSHTCDLFCNDMCWDGFVFEVNGRCNYPYEFDKIEKTCDHFVLFSDSSK